MLGRGGPSIRSRRRRKLIQRQSPELIAFLLLEYLVQRKGREKPCSAYHLATKVVPKTQRLERIQGILELLHENQLVSVIEVEHGTYFEATEKGVQFYSERARPVFGVFVGLYDRPEVSP